MPRHFVLSFLVLISLAGIATCSLGAEPGSKPVDIGNRRQLFVDDYLVETATNADLKTHEPRRQEIAFVFDAPWEGCGCGYSTVLYDPQIKRFRMYYKSWHHSACAPVGNHKDHVVRIAMIESQDGLHWTRPNLGVVEYDGKTSNNLIFASGHDFSPFIDANPKAKPEERYKGTGHFGTKGLMACSSPDGVHWKKMKDGPVFTNGAFDSQNVSFWSATEQKYVLYYRVFENGVRHIKRAVSDNMIDWKEEGLIQFPNGQGPEMRAQFYVNQIFPYYRAPYLYIGFPARYVDNGLTESTKLLPEWDKREQRIKLSQRYGTAVTDTVFISSRDGLHYKQSNDVFVRPGLRTKDNWSYGDNYLTWNVIETRSPDTDSPNELSLYSTESYFTGTETILRRYALRLDGFGSIHARNVDGVVATKPLVFDGAELSLNYRTSAAGLLRVEICDPRGEPLPGFSKNECDVVYGDSLDRRVSWKSKKDVSAIKGKPVVLKFYLRETDVFSFKFE